MTNVLEMSQLDADAQAARDEARLAMIAYWLAKYRGFKPGKPFEEKFREMFDVLETDEAKRVAEAWRSNASVEDSNRFKPIERQIKAWAEAVSSPAR
jgi:hypothetical protein